MASNLTTTYTSQILDLLGVSKFKGGNAPLPPPDKNIPEVGLVMYSRPIRVTCISFN